MKLQIKVNDEGIMKTRVLKLTAAVPLSLPAPWHRMGEREVSRRSAGDQKHRYAEELELPPVKIHCSILAEDGSKPPLRTIKANVKQNKS